MAQSPYVRRESAYGLQQELSGEHAAPRVGGYRVIRRLATGGTCDVLLAKAEGPHGFGRNVVLKLLLSKYAGDEQFARMFAREAAAYARLDHPSIVRLFDFFSLDGQLVMVLEYVDGLTLSRLVSLARAASAELPDNSALYIGSRIFSAIAAAHSAKDPETGAVAPVIHRDVNPTNVLLPWDGHVKIADFGIAKVAGITSDTQTGLIKGTYGYMAPEQVKGEVVTVRADVYAAAIVLWELFAKKTALMRDELPEVELLRAMAEPRLASLDALRPDIDRRVREVMRVALEPDARKRLISAAEIVAVLKSVSPSEDGREKLAAFIEKVRPSQERSISPTPFVGLSQPPPGMPMFANGPNAPNATGSTTQVMPERPPLPKPAVPPRATLTGSNPAMRAPAAQSVGSMSAAIEAAVAAAIETMPTAQELSSTELKSIPPGPPAHPPPMMADKPITGDEPTANLTRPELASLLEPMRDDLAATRTDAPRVFESDSPPATKPLDLRERESGSQKAAAPPPLPKSVQVVVSEPLDRTLALTNAPSGNNSPSGHTRASLGNANTERDLQTPPPPPTSSQNPPSPSPSIEPPQSPRSSMPTQPRIVLPTKETPKKKGGGLSLTLGIAIAVGLLAGGGAALFKYKPEMIRAYTSSKAPATAALTSAIPTAKTSAIVTSTPSAITPAIATGSASAAPTAVTTTSASAAPMASAAPSSAIRVTSSAPATATSASAAPADSAVDAPVPANSAEISTRNAPPQHRIFIDGIVAGETPNAVTVTCGKHTVKIGSAGKPQDVDVACGERKLITDK